MRLELEVTVVTSTGRARYPWRVAMEWVRQNGNLARPAPRAQSALATLVINFSEVVVEDLVQIAHLPTLEVPPSPDEIRRLPASRGGPKNNEPKNASAE